jgi:hypothetical protein
MHEPRSHAREFARKGWRARAAAVAAILPLSLAVLAATPADPASATSGGTVTYSANINVPAPPASNFAGATSGDGWNVGLSPTAVYNVFHHQEFLGVDCHLQANAGQTAPCWGGQETITDTDGSAFYTSGQPTVFLDQSTGYLYVFVTHPEDDTAGVACINTNETPPNLFCGYQPLTAVGQGPPTSSGISGVSDAVQVGSNMYAFNYVNTGAPTGAEDELLCFSLTTDSACPDQPYAVDTGLSGISVSPEPSPSIAAFNNQIVEIPVADGGTTTLACYEPSVAGGSCGGSWPISSGIDYEGSYGTAFPLLNSSAQTLGFCIPDGTDPCWNLSGASAATPSGMSSAIPANTEWNGPAVTVGPRVYLANQDSGHDVYCFDYTADAECANFPKSFSGINNGPYTVNSDPQRPTCIWINSDSGSSQIQNFDAFTGGSCASGPITLQAANFVAPPQACTPTQWTNLQITSPSPPTVYGGGSVEFENNDGGELTGTGGTNPVDLDSTGSVNLTPYNFSAAENLPDFAITLNSPPADLSSVTIVVSWQASNSSSCTEPGTSVSGSVSLIGPAASAPITTSQTISASVINSGAPVSDAAVTFTCVSGPCTTSTGSATTDASGIATFTYSGTVAGTDIWQASYTPSGEQVETSDDAAVVWNFVATAAPNETSYGNTITLGESGLPTTATGTVSFTSGGTTLCTLTLTGLAGEPTSCTTGVLALGSYSVTAAYSGDANDPPSSATTSFAIGQASTTTTAAITDVATSGTWSNTEVPGAVAEDTASVSNSATGTVSYNLYSGDNCLGTLVGTSTEPVTSGSASSSAPSSPLGAGSYSYEAVFNGTTDYDASAGPCQPFTVQRASTYEALEAVDNTTSSAWANPEELGSVASASAAVPSPSDTNGSPPAPTGTVTYSFFDNGTCTGTPATTTPTPIQDGVVANAPDTAALTSGSYSYEAAYSGDSNYLSSTSSCLLLTVAPATPTVGVTPLDTANGETWAGTEVTGASAYATSSVTGVEGFTPTSTITYDFYESSECTGTPLTSSEVSLVDGSPANSPDTGTLGAGTYSVQATYSGDSNYNAGSSSCVPFTVNKAQPTLSAQVEWDSGTTGSQAYDTATVSGIDGFTPTGTVTYYIYDNATCGGDVEGQAVTLSDGNVPNSPTTPPLGAGGYSYQASYSGDSNYLPTTGRCLTFSIGLGVPQVSQQVDDAATHALWSGHETLGASAVDTATVTGVAGFTPTGIVTYQLFDNGTCSGTPSSTDEAELAGNGDVPSSSVTGKLNAGTYGYQFVYSGDANYGVIESACEPFSVLPAASSTGGSVDDAATQSAWSGGEDQGASAYDTATVSGIPGYSPTGTVTYTLYTDASCSGKPMSTQTVKLSGGKVPNSSRTGELPPGWFSYRASYTGSSQYRPSSGRCEAFSAAALGYRLEGGDGGVFDFHSHFRGSVPRLGLHIYDFVGMAAMTDGYWLVESNGGIFAFGSAHNYGSLPSRGIHVDNIIGIAATADGKGYWEVASDGTVYPFGDAVLRGDLRTMGVHVKDIVAIYSPDSGGYWLVGSDGRVFPFGDAKSHGSCVSSGSACRGVKDIVGIASPDAGGYLLVGSDGRVFPFGDAKSHGSCVSSGSACRGVKDIVGIASPGSDDGGYWLAGANGAVYAFGDAKNFGNETEAETHARLTRPIIAITG